MGAYLSRESILAANDLPTEDVQVPEWADPETGADTVRVRGLTGEGRDEFEASTTVVRGKTAIRDTANSRAKLVSHCVIDHETGALLFTRQDVDALGKKSGAALGRVFAVAARLSGLVVADEDEEELEGKSSDPDGEGSPSS